MFFPLKKKVSNVASDSASEIVNLLASSSDVRVTITEPRRSRRCRTKTYFGPEFVTDFLVETLDNLDVDVITEEFASNFLIEEDLKPIKRL